MRSTKKKGRAQAAALPYRLDGGQPSILLVTSRETRRWVIPKGWVAKGEKPAQAAKREAFEEAGLTGKLLKSIGTYSYVKRLPDGSTLDCEVRVFPMRVEARKKKWPERGLREGRWFAPAEAFEAVDEPGLKDLIALFEPVEADTAPEGPVSA